MTGRVSSRPLNSLPVLHKKVLNDENNSLKETDMINLKLLNQALDKVSSDEFKALYIIANTISFKKEGRTRIYREHIADMLGWTNDNRPEYALKKVTRVTNSLVEKGFLVKEDIYVTPQKKVTFYSLPVQEIKQNCTQSEQKSDKKLIPSVQKNVPINNIEKEPIIEKRTNNRKKEELELEEEIVPDEEDLSQYLARMKRMKERLAAGA